ncbi:MAG TPA: PHB depolymerase family esterase [Polyangia bacterium]|nr:PHB depolymerase family esterase [Polyangia bacterium]
MRLAAASVAVGVAGVGCGEGGPPGPACHDPCTLGATRCDGTGGVATCMAAGGGCAAWSDPVACAGGATCMAGACVSCQGGPGALHDQVLSVSGEPRHYFLYVPSSYQCARAWPLLVDFHGTGAATDPGARVEEYYAQDELVALAEHEGFLVARPRSRYANEGGGQLLFRWDENAGDLAKNVAFARALVGDIAGRYHVDPARTYTSGFSNGTNMALQFMGDTLFRGYAVVGGGIWDRVTRGPFGADAPRIYATTGYRDYMYQYLRELSGWLDAHGYPRARLMQRQTDTGHALYGWHFAELWAWLDRGERPGPGSGLAPGWTQEAPLPDGATAIQLARTPSADLLAAGAEGRLWRRDSATGVWSRVAMLNGSDGFAPNLTDLCLLPSGRGLAIGEGTLAVSDDGGATWTVAPHVPEFGAMNFGFSYLNGIACAGGLVVGGGYWSAALSHDGGHTWSAATMSEGSYGAQVAAVHATADGAWIATGYYDYISRSTDGQTFEAVATPDPREWWNGIASAPGGHVWVVGEAGGLLSSRDGGRSFVSASAPRRDDLYAVAFRDALHGLAVGLHGAALATSDGGASWRDVSSGLDLTLTDVTWLDARSALAVGEGGAVLTYAP